MVSGIANVNQSGIRSFLIQRVSGVVILLYVLCLLSFFLNHTMVDYATWVQFIRGNLMRSFTLLSLFCLVYHAWIGVWGVLTDYVKCAFGRIFLQVLFILMLLLSLIWAAIVLF